MHYVLRAGDRLDRICWQYYGSLDGTLEKVLEANPGLADLGPVVPPRSSVVPNLSSETPFQEGKTIFLPDIDVQASRTQTVQLWD